MKDKTLYLIGGALILGYLLMKYSRPGYSSEVGEEMPKSVRTYKSYILPGAAILATAGVILSFRNGLYEVRTEDGFDKEKLKEVMEKNWNDIKELPGNVINALQSLTTHSVKIFRKGVEFVSNIKMPFGEKKEISEDIEMGTIQSETQGKQEFEIN